MGSHDTCMAHQWRSLVALNNGLSFFALTYNAHPPWLLVSFVFFESAACIMMNKDKDKNRMERLATAMLHTKCFLFYSFCIGSG